MDEAKALSIVSALANGVNPSTGEVFAADSPYQAPDVVRALFTVVRLLEAKPKVRPRAEAANNAASNAGKPWTAEEDQQLLRDFDRGTGIPDLARSHGRTTAGIQARLEKHGRIQPAADADRRQRTWRNGPEAIRR